jgi:hypothetical protein
MASEKYLTPQMSPKVYSPVNYLSKYKVATITTKLPCVRNNLPYRMQLKKKPSTFDIRN